MEGRENRRYNKNSKASLEGNKKKKTKINKRRFRSVKQPQKGMTMEEVT